MYTGKEVQKPWVSAGVLWKPPKRRLWRMKRGGFEEVSRFSRHNVAGNRLTRRCRLSFAIERKLPAGGNRRKNYWENMPLEAIEERIPSGRKRKIPQKRIDISLIPAII